MAATDTRRESYQRVYDAARADLLARIRPEGFWEGRLSSSALSTATALSAFAVAAPDEYRHYIERGAAWLSRHQNGDGGWGDSPESPSNTPTTMLALASFSLAAAAGADIPPSCLTRGAEYLEKHAGTTVDERVRTIRALYGNDRTFAAPILANAALAPATDSSCVTWAQVPGLPFELALCPRALFRVLRLHVVSYALPALIAIGQLVHAKRPSRNIVMRLIRNVAVPRTLRSLESIQPDSGGFLEAIPLTSFVVMSLAAADSREHAVVQKGLKFLERLARDDGSWPIEANLSGWLTSLAVTALTAGGRTLGTNYASVREWLLARQHRVVHPYTGSPPGGWGWTHLPGAVPDADDTAAALIALSRLGGDVDAAARGGVSWLLELQNRDGGWPTFCRGWGKLPFDRSAPDLTAHALRALWTWRSAQPRKRIDRAVSCGFAYLRRVQRSDGAWTPLWFGNQHAAHQENPVYGTARVLAMFRDTGNMHVPEARRGMEYLLSAQNQDGSWSGDRDGPGSVEETALAVEALAAWHESRAAVHACLRGADRLCDEAERGGFEHPAPIGLYFACLWYAERLYPRIWAVGALGECLGALTADAATAPDTGSVNDGKSNA